MAQLNFKIYPKGVVFLLDSLILAYRNKFYCWDLKKSIAFFKTNKEMLLLILGLISAGIATTIYSILASTNTWLVVFLLAEIVLWFIADHITVKRYQRVIANGKRHINEVTILLQTAIPNNNLLGKRQVEELIMRLSDRIEIGAPFHKFMLSLSKFRKVIILPTIAYIAGIYTGNIRELEFTVVITWATSIVLLIGLSYLAWGMIAQGLQKMTCRNYDAAVALKEDLLDIRLLFFANDGKQQID